MQKDVQKFGSKMLFAVELPPSLLRQFTVQTDYDFVIAPMFLENEAYRNFFLQNRRPFTILDNGAFEAGKAIPEKIYLEVIEQLNPDVIVLPDERTDAEATAIRAIGFLEKYGEKCFPLTKFMGVVQGKSMQEWETLLQMYLDRGVTFIGVPYGTNDRVEFIRRHPEVKFHALGLKFLPEILSLRLLKNVVSLDTSLPVKFAYKHLTFVIYGLDVLTVDERPALTVDFDRIQIDTLQENFTFLQKVCDRS